MSLFDDLPPPEADNKSLKRKLDNTKSDISDTSKCTKSDSHDWLTKFKSFVFSRKGEREEMQDAHILIDDFKNFIVNNNPSIKLHNDVLRCGFYGVYDGHNGCLASNYAADNLHKYMGSLFPKGNLKIIEQDIKKIYYEVYNKVEDEILKLVMKQRPPLRDGSTAVNILIVNNSIYVANIGDSKAVLARLKPVDTETDKKTEVIGIPLTKDHSPIDIEERTRIQNHGSFVKDGRVNGLLEVSRSFGDIQYKRQGVICLPDVKKCKVTEADKFIIIACDGVWKVFTPQDAVDYVYKIVSSKNIEDISKKYETACTKLVNESILRMSGDNVTVIIVAFNIE